MIKCEFQIGFDRMSRRRKISYNGARKEIHFKDEPIDVRASNEFATRKIVAIFNYPTKDNSPEVT